MLSPRPHPSLLAFLLFAAACGGGDPVMPPPPPPPPGSLPSPSVACASRPQTQLAVGEHVVLDPLATGGCLRVPAAGATGAQYLLVLASGQGDRTSGGVQSTYLLRASSPQASSASPAPWPDLAPGLESTPIRRSVAAEFDAMLRERERELAADPLLRQAPQPAPSSAATAPPPLGDVKDFKVCGNLTCSSVVAVQATARYVGTKVAVYIDNVVPQSDPLQDADAAELGASFDDFHYPIDTTAFGRESDLDGNGVVIVLMTDAVNNLTPDCTNGRIVGYFFGGDLLIGPANSNRAEIFFTLVPAPQTPTCSAISRKTAVDNLKPTLIHEFQHMISFNQHVLIRSGSSEEVWLNEGLSHIAEELGGRLIPNSECMPAFPSCRSQYASGDLINSYDYLKNTEAIFLVFPSGGGSLEERGAGWLFVRWVLDQFAADSILASATTRALVATSLTGAANVSAVTGASFATMVPQWLMAAYLDDGTDLPEEATGRLRYKSWGLRAIWTNPLNQAPAGPFNGFPLAPQDIGGNFSRSGTLRGGSGRHFLIVQQGSGPAIDLQVLRSTAGSQLDAGLLARFGLVRIR